MNTNYIIPAFAEPITSLPDTPTLTADELKRRFQAPADEVREAHNALAEAHEALDTKVESIVTETFAGAIHESMFDEALDEKLNGKADENSVSERLTAEQTARESADSALSEAQTVLTTAIAQKCEVYLGTYTPSQTENTDYIELGFQPKAVLLLARYPEGNYVYPIRLALPNVPHDDVRIYSNGFAVDFDDYRDSADAAPYRYIAFK
ncbi:MAG: hypothetical protein Q3Y08_10350 [Butyricicoccus sp.]|nr:hypothetical protein [Butyricicoccus sp.]